MNIGLAIQEIRQNKGLSKGAVAMRAGITEVTLNKVESGDYPSRETFRLIATALGVTTGFILLMAMDKDDFHPSKQKYLEDTLPHIKGLLMFLAK